MLWHVVRFRFPPDVDPGARAAVERDLAAMAGHVDELRFLRVARSVDEPDVTGLLSGLDDELALERYRDHPGHVPVATRARELATEVVRLDVVTDDPPDALPRALG